MMNNVEQTTEVLTSYRLIPYALLTRNIDSAIRSGFEKELGEIINLYRVYKEGAEFLTEGTNGDYVAANLRHKNAKSILNKEARFLFSKAPDVTVSALDIDSKKDKDEAVKYQNLVDKVLKRNGFKKKLLQASKDCFVGKRVAIMLNFNPETGVGVSFIKSLEFYYETDIQDENKLNKIVTFCRVVDSESIDNSRIFEKTYYMGDDGYCHVIENMCNGSGVIVEEITPDTATLFTYIPATVVVNDGLLGDGKGESEIDELKDDESWYSMLSNADMDAERKSMNPTKYTMDCSPESTSNLSTSAGAYWDLQSDQNSATDKQGSAGILEPTMAYKDALKGTLDRIKNNMYEKVDVPNVTSEALQGVVTSGKTLKAIYWGLIVRCDEKMLAWEPALEFMVNTIIEGCILYPECLDLYNIDKLEEIDYEVEVTNNYPIPEDEIEEKTMDNTEVINQNMSRKAYMKKWRGLTDEEVMEELKQIALEREILEDSYSGLPEIDNTSPQFKKGENGDENDTETGEETDEENDEALENPVEE